MARRKCRYCGYSLLHIWKDLYECTRIRCNAKYLFGNFHGKMIDMTTITNQFKKFDLSDVFVEDDALAYGIYKTSLSGFAKYVIEAKSWFEFIRIELGAGPRTTNDEPDIVMYAKSNKDRKEFNEDVRKFMASLREQGSHLYLTTAVLQF